MTTADELARSVRAWRSTLDGDQRERSSFRFDDPERVVWAFTPGERAGLALGDMAPEQRSAATRIVEAAMSARGAREVAAVIALEAVLGALERDQGRSNWPRRDPDLYWFAVFGDPVDRGHGRGAVGVADRRSPRGHPDDGRGRRGRRQHAVVPGGQPGGHSRRPPRRGADADG